MLIDGLIITVLLVAAAAGVHRGLLREVVSLAAWSVALFLSIVHYETLSAWLGELLPGPPLRALLIALLVVGMTALALALLELSWGALSRRRGRGHHDPLFGLLFGALRGVLAITVVVVLAHRTPLPTRLDWYQSQFVGYAEALATTVRPHLPPPLAAQIVLRDSDPTDKKIILPRDRRGHFVGKAYVNGIPVEVLADTGATMVMVPKHLAGKLGLTPRQRFPVNTATEQVIAERTVIDALKIGPVLLHDVDAALVETPKDVVLIGMSFLLKTRFRHTQHGLLIEQARASTGP